MPPVTKPELLPTVATEVLLVLQIPPVIASLNVVGNVEHTVDAPSIAVGLAMTVKVWVAAAPHPVE